ncbi:hypothetical protein M2408_005239 [Sphingobacterium sp. BIGb0165]|nr:hypothetical protein [Sphingobacterium sp. BIGb0165]
MGIDWLGPTKRQIYSREYILIYSSFRLSQTFA